MAEESILSSIVKGVERLPGNLVGAPVDISNLVLGAVAGKGMSGFVDWPVGGSEQLNSMFGLGNPERIPTAQTITEIVTGFVNPATAAKTAMIVGLPIAMRTGRAMEKFSEMEKAGAHVAEIFAGTNIFTGSHDKLLRTVIDDTPAMIRSSALIEHEGNKFVGMNKKVGDLIDHPELFKQYPDLKNIKVDVMKGKPGEAAYNSKSNTVFLAGAPDTERIKKSLLHELQHAVQSREGFSRGTNISAQLGDSGVEVISTLRKEMETASPEQTTILQEKLRNILEGAQNRYLKAPGEQEASFTEINANNPDLKETVNFLLSRGRDPQSWKK